MGHATSRREFMRLGAMAAGAGMSTPAAAHQRGAEANRERQATLERVGATPVLRRELWPAPVPIASIELLKGPADFLVRVRSRDGAEGLAAGHPDVLETAWPILTRRVAPFFIGKDARDLESLVDGVYLASSNYKWQGLPFWVPVASVEIALLDLLGKIARKPLGELFGAVVRRDVAVYRASGNRGNSPEAEIAYLRRLVDETGAKAIKFRLGRAHAIRRRLDPARPGDDPAHTQDVRRRHDHLRRRERLVRRADVAAHRAPDAGASACVPRGAGAVRFLRRDEGRSPTRCPSLLPAANRKAACGASAG